MTSSAEPQAAADDQHGAESPGAADQNVFDVVVIGAGPAGLAAAASAAEAGMAVILLDSGARPGGQYWRSGAMTPSVDVHHGWTKFVRLQSRLHAARVVCRQRHHVVTVVAADEGWLVHCAVGSDPRTAKQLSMVRGRRLVIATGSYDREMPFPGWDLPGVMTAGGAQALLKGHGVVAGSRIVVAGTGPLLLPVAEGLLRAGAQVPAVIEANSPSGFIRHPKALLGAAGKLGEGAGYLAQLAKARTPYRRRTAVVRALGHSQLEAVEIAQLDRSGRVVPGAVETLACDVLAVGWGLTAQLELHLQAGCATVIGADGGLVVDVDAEQRTSVDGVLAAGEATGVGGADLAIVEGEIAGRSAAGVSSHARLVARRARLRRFADAVHDVHPVPSFLLDELPDDVVVCRCEEVTAGAAREAVREFGATDARTVKLLSRVGMGMCQGRICGFAAACVTAASCERSPQEADLRAFAERPLAAPITLGLLARDG